MIPPVANVATPGDSLLQEASAGQPNQQDQRRLPEEGLPFLTAPAEWCGGDTTTRYERIAAIGGFVGAADGLHVVVGGLCSLRSALWSKLQQKLVEF
jgi:hypothetical protein